MTRACTLFALLFATSNALAVPLEMSHQGRLWDSTGVPLDGSTSLEFNLYENTSGGTAVWTESHTADIDNGFFSVALGSVQALDASIFDGDPLYLGIKVDGGAELTDRLPLISVPYAIHAGSVAPGSSVDVSQVSVGGAVVISNTGMIDWSSIENAPSYADASHTHAATEVNSGTLAMAQLPVGTSNDTVARGNHSHTAAEVGAMPATGGAFTGAVQVGDSTDDLCVSGEAGSIRWDGTELQACDGSGEWKTIRLIGANDGSDPTTAALTCKTLHADNPSLANGEYWIDPDGLDTGNGPIKGYCDMVTDGGGWTLLLSYDHNDDLVPGSPNLMTYSWNSGSPSENADYARDWRVVPDSVFTDGSSEIMLKRIGPGDTMVFTIKSWVGWDTVCTAWDSRCGYNDKMSMYAIVEHPSHSGYDYYFHSCDGPNCHGTNTYEAVGVDCHADYTSNYTHGNNGGTSYSGGNQQNCPAGADPDLYGFGATSPQSNRFGSWGTSLNNVDLGRVAFYFRE